MSDSTELYLKNLQTKKLYVKFFEVEPDKVFGAIPTAKTDLHIWTGTEGDSIRQQTILNLEVIPTIYIRNTVFSTGNVNIDTLADNIIFLTNKYYKERIRQGNPDFKEIQIDCDWTEKTKEKYFSLLSAIKKFSGKTVSCTLRLYPYKYPDKMGVPPVDKATLMCYNLISPMQHENQNSILSTNELRKYLRGAHHYPLHLDMALPVFSYLYVYQHNQLAGLISLSDIDIETDLQPTKPLWYVSTRDKEIGNIYLRTGDKIKIETISEATIKETIDLLQEYVGFDDVTTVSLFHLDAQNLQPYKNEALNSFYTDFTK